MLWFHIRKAKISDDELREAFERYGTVNMQMLLARSGQFRKGPAGSLTNVSIVEDPLLDWLTEQYDRERRKETWSLAMEVAVVVFVGAELLFSVFSRTAVAGFSGLAFSMFRALFRCLIGFHPLISLGTYLPFLSKATTSHALHFSEVALLLCGIVLGVGIIGEYSDRWKDRKDLLKSFKLMVILGIFGEVAADAAIFSFTERLTTISNQELGDAQAKAARADNARVQLERQMAWRHLTSKQQVALCQAIPAKFTREILVVSSPQDPEAWQYASEFASPLRDFGISHGFGAMGHLGTQAWSKVVFGVRIQLGTKTNFDVNLKQRLALATQLREALEQSGVEVAGVSTEDGDIGPLLRLYVGPRFPPQTEDTISADKKP